MMIHGGVYALPNAAATSSERLGHASIMTTLDLYTHVSVDLQQAAVDAMAERLLDESDTTTSPSRSDG